MPSLSGYSQDLPYSYAPGFFPAMESLLHRSECVERVLLHPKAEGTEGAEKLRALADACHVRVEMAERVLSRISGKENCYAASVFRKFEDTLHSDRPHVILHHPSDSGNVGTILRTALGFGVEDVGLIRPCVDLFDPRTVRASMGSLFSLRVHVWDSFEAYQAQYGKHQMYPFMLSASLPMEEVLEGDVPYPYALIFGNEGSGLPDSFASVGRSVRIPSSDRVDSLNLSVAAAIGIYAFSGKFRKNEKVCNKTGQ